MPVPGSAVPELWQWTEYYCPWSYIAAVRLHAVMPEFAGQVMLRTRAFPLEVVGGGPPNRHELEQEWWLAAQQEPLAEFAPYRSTDWPQSTLAAFDAVACAHRQGVDVGHDFDLRVRRAFFNESRNIGRREVMADLAREAGLDMSAFERDFGDPAIRQGVLADARYGHDQLGVRGTPTLMSSDGTVLEFPLAEPHFEDGRVAAIRPLPCYGESCLEATRTLVSQALAQRVNAD
jgi:predicted DsbA family dithiol-disulfide isomerase